MHTKIKILSLALLISLSFASFCYLNFSSTELEGVVGFTNVIPTESAELNSMLPELELIEWIVKKILPLEGIIGFKNVMPTTSTELNSILSELGFIEWVTQKTLSVIINR